MCSTRYFLGYLLQFQCYFTRVLIHSSLLKREICLLCQSVDTRTRWENPIHLNSIRKTTLQNFFGKWKQEVQKYDQLLSIVFHTDVLQNNQGVCHSDGKYLRCLVLSSNPVRYVVCCDTLVFVCSSQAATAIVLFVESFTFRVDVFSLMINLILLE
jgi:hypothetical protein